MLGVISALSFPCGGPSFRSPTAFGALGKPPTQYRDQVKHPTPGPNVRFWNRKSIPKEAGNRLLFLLPVAGALLDKIA
jgi:hypothetical protein